MNPTDQTLDLEFRQKKSTLKGDMKQLAEKDVEFDSSKDKFIMTTYQIPIRQHNSIIFVIITNKDISDSHIKPNRYFSIR
jgi:hypothetical protein